MTPKRRITVTLPDCIEGILPKQGHFDLLKVEAVITMAKGLK